MASSSSSFCQIASPDHVLEDSVVILEGRSRSFFAVFDGHEGPDAACFLKEKFFANDKAENPGWEHSGASKAPEHGKQLDESLLRRKMEKRFASAEKQCLKAFEKSGSCAVAIELDLETGLLACGNVGDCCALFEGTVLSTEHRAADAELERIKAAGGWVQDSRVFGMLQPTRSLGDHDLKCNGIPPPPLNNKRRSQMLKNGEVDTRKPSGDARQVVIATPSISIVDASAGGILILGSDGLFDFVKPSQCFATAKLLRSKGATPTKVAERLCTMAQSKKSRDDISAVVCFIEPAGSRKPSEPIFKCFKDIEESYTVVVQVTAAVVAEPPTPEQPRVPDASREEPNVGVALAVVCGSALAYGIATLS